MDSLIPNIVRWTNQLKKYYHDVHAATSAVWQLLEYVSGLSREKILVNTTLDISVIQTIDRYIQRMIHDHIPLAYIIGSIEFFGTVVQCKPPVLIPRPETEQWCAEMITFLKNQNIQSVLDVGTGTGCIAIASAQVWPLAQIHAVDNDETALQLARINCMSYTNIHVYNSHFFESVIEQFDLIVANPPYISEADYNVLDLSVKQWESKNALLSDDEGYAHLSFIIQQAKQFLRPSGWLWCEIGKNQDTQVKQLFADNNYQNITIIVDYAGIIRAIGGQW